MVKNGCLPDLSGIWVTKKPLKFSDFLMVDSKWLQLFTTNHLPMQKVIIKYKAFIINNIIVLEFLLRDKLGTKSDA